MDENSRLLPSSSARRDREPLARRRKLAYNLTLIFIVVGILLSLAWLIFSKRSYSDNRESTYHLLHTEKDINLIALSNKENDIKEEQMKKDYFYGRDKLNEKYELEEELTKKDIRLKNGSPAHFHQIFLKSTERAREIANCAVIAENAQKKLKKRDETSGVKYGCMQNTSTYCNSKQPYREIDGRCNNLKNPDWGSSYSAFIRLLDPDYSDEISAPRKSRSGKDLPSARLISNSLYTRKSQVESRCTLMTMLWGLFVDHDITNTAVSQGDRRANEHVELTVIHTIWMREHNRLAEILENLNPEWDDETLFQEARKIVIAELQHITYNEYLPLLFGIENINKYNLKLLSDGYFDGYNASFDATASNVFASAAFRFGHSQVQSYIQLYSSKGDEKKLPLHDTFFNPTVFYTEGLDDVIRGATKQRSKIVWSQISDEVRNRLFQSHYSHYGMDLSSISIQRSRDHGIPSYNIWRQYCGFSKITSWEQLEDVLDEENAKRLKKLYESVDDVDLIPAALSERKSENAGILGPTHSCLTAEQFARMRIGDRFWYENKDVFSEVAVQLCPRDRRANEHVELTVIHTIWMREHNRLAEILENLNPEWDDETLFQEARKIVIAELQHITYNEYLPLLFGIENINKYNLKLLSDGYFDGYNASSDATASNVFASAAFRFGHSQVQSYIQLYSSKGDEKKLPLHDTFFNPTVFYTEGLDDVIRGATKQRSKIVWSQISDEVRNRLFQSHYSHYGMDLSSISIQRSRDHGIPSYNIWRQYCGFSKITSWEQLEDVLDEENAKRLKKLYESVDDVDLIPAALSERKSENAGILGPTHSCLTAEQFARMRIGDRFWYENKDVFSPDQLREIRKVTLSRVLCDNSDNLLTIQKWALHPESKKNPIVHCANSTDIPEINLQPWSS
ncbi:lactoperoxidase-like [Centruroides sculpturatus]|uniref:lactoperoxidase-like n=1 Tax=Centruroides sculpturatus TaxID=218467 RepID=UPI000C6D5BDB|nr:lactoperoxidase-like [Centruroides sculpturatus]